jgi:site-specific recombinase XerD
MSENRQRDLTPTEAAERFIAKRRNKNTEKTVRSYENRLRQFVRWAHERDDVETMRDLDGWIIDEYERFLDERGDAPATVQGKLVALNELVKYCVRLDVVDADLPQRVEIPNLSKDDQTSDKMLEAPDARRLLQYYRNSTKDYGTRHHVTLELMWHVGGRISCFLALDLEDYDADEQVLRFRHRPPTRLKDGTDHERNVALTDATADALDFWIARERYDKKDENGRTPLLTTAQGRPAESTLQTWAYQATQPCMATACPHNRKRATCEYTQKSHASKCPSSRSPHAIRTGSITWQLNRGLSYVKVAERVASSPETIRRYYDKPDLDDELARRRPETNDLDILHDNEGGSDD